ncbi:DUF1810 domain-containing protein [Sphingomonas sp. AX6]|uniref:DUF1810 domain-containing protein n=1 Tax=Sphingomonas sp. AX6 TaxID=2653171 RepID=UPI0012F4210E|nr:DUF1810 domain-containing protein [Sphingomonas sp. AX6]VXC98517.1 conserved hypothetical protein [Sphingomonas sp. AX6]
MSTTHPHELQRFISAQDGTYTEALAEIRRGRKRTHWMWFIFPQLAGLGRSEIAKHYAIGSIDEAKAYLTDPILGPRLREAVAALQDLQDVSAIDVFGEIDALKLRSSLTLFSMAGGGPLFEAAIIRWFGSPDPATVALIDRKRSD